MAQQKDALQLAFNFTFDTRVKEKFIKYRLPNVKNNQKAKDFLKCIDIKYNEDSFINHDLQDMSKFRNWIVKEQTPVSRIFQHGSKSLLVTNVNRDRQYEKTLGVDLIYYNHEYSSFIMVQYKRWQQEGQSQDFCYRPDSQYYKDIERMETAEKFLKGKAKDNILKFRDFQKIIQSQRLNENPFYFKFCHPTQLNYTNEMISGCYIDFLYCDSIINQRLGNRGGKILREKDLINPIKNELFIDLVKNGLIGTRDIDENILNDIVKNLLEQGNSITFAESFVKKPSKIAQ